MAALTIYTAPVGYLLLTLAALPLPAGIVFRMVTGACGRSGRLPI